MRITSSGSTKSGSEFWDAFKSSSRSIGCCMRGECKIFFFTLPPFTFTYTAGGSYLGTFAFLETVVSEAPCPWEVLPLMSPLGFVSLFPSTFCCFPSSSSESPTLSNECVKSAVPSRLKLLNCLIEKGPLIHVQLKCVCYHDHIMSVKQTVNLGDV